MRRRARFFTTSRRRRTRNRSWRWGGKTLGARFEQISSTTRASTLTTQPLAGKRQVHLSSAICHDIHQATSATHLSPTKPPQLSQPPTKLLATRVKRAEALLYQETGTQSLMRHQLTEKSNRTSSGGEASRLLAQPLARPRGVRREVRGSALFAATAESPQAVAHDWSSNRAKIALRRMPPAQPPAAQPQRSLQHRSLCRSLQRSLHQRSLQRGLQVQSLRRSLWRSLCRRSPQRSHNPRRRWRRPNTCPRLPLRLVPRPLQVQLSLHRRLQRSLRRCIRRRALPTRDLPTRSAAEVGQPPAQPLARPKGRVRHRHHRGGAAAPGRSPRGATTTSTARNQATATAGTNSTSRAGASRNGTSSNFPRLQRRD